MALTLLAARDEMQVKRVETKGEAPQLTRCRPKLVGPTHQRASRQAKVGGATCQRSPIPDLSEVVPFVEVLESATAKIETPGAGKGHCPVKHQ